tara:strand:+ start:930 stop:1199 length:270 start_codon:yes stop_codon:yes gene_type:complete
MTKNVATINNNGLVIEINIYPDNYELKSNQILVTNPAFVGGDYVDGYFYPTQPFLSWTRDNGNWISPIPYPKDEQLYSWNEQNQSWDLI